MPDDTNISVDKTRLAVWIGLNLRAAREELELSQAQLSECVEIGSNQIGHIEHGRSHTSLPTLIKLAGQLNIGVSRLFEVPDLDIEELREAVDLIEWMMKYPRKRARLLRSILSAFDRYGLN